MPVAQDARATKVAIELHRVGECSTSAPHAIEIELGNTLMTLVARGVLALRGVAAGVSELRVPLDAPYRLLNADGNDFPGAGADAAPDDAEARSQFAPSSVWLMVEERDIGIQVWDEHSDDELRGQAYFAEVSGLTERVHAAVAIETEAFLKRVGNATA